MTPAAKDELYMQRCLELARKGMGLTRQNPLVGSVIVYNDRIIGEGFHKEFGGPHAEINAIDSVKDKSLLKNSTLYVNLEPCSHQGKTPPCSARIKDLGIMRVVIGCLDSNPEVSGRGAELLNRAGTEVVTGVLGEASRFLNRRFYTFHEKKRPFVILKWAQTPDGFIDQDRKRTGKKSPEWITNQTSRMLVHKWRSEEISIMAGTETILLDNPELNVREWPGLSPIRIIPDKNGRIDSGLNVMNGDSSTIIFSGDKKTGNGNPEIIYLDPENFEISIFLKELYKRNILSVFVEGGAKLIRSFIDSGLWDETFVFYGNKSFNSGVNAPLIGRKPEEKVDFRGIKLYVYRNNAVIS